MESTRLTHTHIYIILTKKGYISLDLVKTRRFIGKLVKYFPFFLQNIRSKIYENGITGGKYPVLDRFLLADKLYGIASVETGQFFRFMQILP